MPNSNDTFHRIRFLVWLISAYLRKRALFIILGLVFGVIFGLKSKDLITLLIKQNQDERIGVIGNYTQNTLPKEIQNMISYGLTSTDHSDNLLPQAASSFEISKDGKEYTFRLEKNIIWQDGKKFTASDINYTFKDVKVKLEDPYTIKFMLAEAFAPFPSLVTQPLFKRGLIGLGTYKVESLETAGKFISKLTLASNEKRVLFKFYPTEGEAITAYKLAEVNTVWGLKNIEPIRNWTHVKIIPITQDKQFVGLFFNTKKGILGEKQFRQALNYALEDDKIKERKINSPISENSWAYNPNVKPYHYSLDSATNLLTKINEASDTAKIRLRLTVLHPYEKYSQLIADSWKRLGIETKLEVVSIPPPTFEILLAAQEVPIDPDQYLLWHSTSKVNITGYNNPRIDKLLEDGRKTTDKKTRKQIYQDFQRYLIEDSPAIFLYYPTTYTVTRS